MNFISFFSGIGGFDLGFELAGMICVAQIEIDNACRLILGNHWPSVDRRHKDVKKIKAKELPDADVWCGGFPCQDVSIAGKGAGLAGKRSGLWFDFHGLIASRLPKWVVIENVPGLLSSNLGKDFAIILGGLTGVVPEVPEEGWGSAGLARGPVYSVAYRILDSQYFGLAQRRKRVFVVASLGSGSCAEVLFEREGLPRDPAQSRSQGQGPASPLTANPQSRRNGGSNPTADAMIVADTITAQYASNRGAQAGNASKVTNLIAAPIAGHHPRTDLDTETFVVGAVSSKWAKGTGGPAGDETYNLIPDMIGTLQAHSKEHGHAMTTQQAVEGGQILAGALGARRLTPTECERLQGFPDGWTAVEGQKDSARYRQLGNAVSVPVLEWIGRRIMIVEEGGKP
jgi:DNA (cytosine-5)-methyltransferase 1